MRVAGGIKALVRGWIALAIKLDMRYFLQTSLLLPDVEQLGWSQTNL